MRIECEDLAMQGWFALRHRFRDHRVNQILKEAFDRNRSASQRRKPFDDPFLSSMHKLDQHVLFGREMEVKGAARHAGGANDFINLRFGKTDPPELVDSSVKDTVACILALLITPAELENLAQPRSFV